MKESRVINVDIDPFSENIVNQKGVNKTCFVLTKSINLSVVEFVSKFLVTLKNNHYQVNQLMGVSQTDVEVGSHSLYW